MKKFIRFMAGLALCGLMLAGTLIPMGCGKGDDYTIDMNPDFNNKPQLSIIFPPTGMTNENLNSNYNVNLIKNITGYDVKYSQFRGSNEENDARSLIQNREEGVNLMKLSSGSFDALAPQDLFVDLTEVLDVFGPNIKATIDEELWETVTYNGKIYGIPEAAFSLMRDNALVFNKSHIAALGKYPEGWVPQTLTEFTTLLGEFDAQFGSNNEYRAFGLPGTLGDCSAISAAFGLPSDYYENEQGKIASMIYHDSYTKYLLYMNSIKTEYMRTAWSSSLGSGIAREFARGNFSVAYMPYWDMASVCEQMVANNASYATVAEAKADLAWQLSLKGDGTNGSLTQDKAVYRCKGVGNAYILAVPFYMAKNTAYVIDWINTKQKEENVIKFLTGEENVTYEFTTADDPDAIEVTYSSESVNHGTKYYKLLPSYRNVEGNSMYGTGNISAIGKAFWPLRAKSYDVWDILIDIGDDTIQNPIARRPLLTEFAKRRQAMESKILTSIQNSISASDASNVTKEIDALKLVVPSSYWNATVENEVNGWWTSK